MTESDVHIVFLDGLKLNLGGGTKRRIALRLNEEDADVVTLSLDSSQGRSRQAKKWAAAFSLDRNLLETKLRTAALAAAKQLQEHRTNDRPRVPESPSPVRITLAEARPDG